NDECRDERGEHRSRGGVGSRPARDARPEESDQQRSGERRGEADPGGDDHPRRKLSLSTSRSMRFWAIATIRPRPTTTSAAATAITARAKIWPLASPWSRANAI